MNEDALALIEEAMGMTLSQMQLANMDEAEAFARLGLAYVEMKRDRDQLQRQLDDAAVPF